MGKVAGRRVEGSVTEYNGGRGYGFLITVDLEHNQDIFFHISEMDVDHVQVGSRFEFTIEDSEKGYRATDAEKLAEPPSRDGDEPTHSPGVKTNSEDVSADQFMLEQQKRAAADDDEDDEESTLDPFSDDLRGSKNDLL